MLLLPLVFELIWQLSTGVRHSGWRNTQLSITMIIGAIQIGGLLLFLWRENAGWWIALVIGSVLVTVMFCKLALHRPYTDIHRLLKEATLFDRG